MADTSNTTPADDGRARVNQNGTVDTGGRDAFVWCTDETGHRFDLPARCLPRKGVEVVEGYPLNFKRFARTAKTRLELAGDPAEADQHGELNAGDQVAPEPAAGGDEQHAQGAGGDEQHAQGADVVEAPAPEVEPSGDDQHAAGADATDADRVEAPAGPDNPEADAGDVDAAPTKKTRRATR